MSDTVIPSVFPVLPLRDIVVFPHMIVPLFVGREKSISALEAVMAEDKQIILVTQREADTEDPDADGLYSIGTVGSILQLLKLPDGAVKVLVLDGSGRDRGTHGACVCVLAAVRVCAPHRKPCCKHQRN